MPPATTRGSLLVASPQLGDGVFDRTVVFMVEHHSDGALGVVVNRPTREETLPGLGSWVSSLVPPSHVFWGGPVEPDALIGLGRFAPWVPGDSIGDRLRVLDLSAPPPDDGSVEGARIFRGYAGWAPRQLDDELAHDAWIVCPATDGDVLAGDPARLWRDVLRRQPGRLAWLANYPDDPQLN